MSYGTPPPPGGAYGQQPPYGGGPVPNHGSATTALVLGILSFVCCGLLGIPAYVIGRRAEREIQASHGTIGGEGLAKAGWILGLVSILLMALSIVLVVILLAVGALGSSSGSFDNSGY